MHVRRAAVGIIYYGIVVISNTTIYSNIYSTISISRVRRAVGTSDTEVAEAADIAIWGHGPRSAADAVRDRRESKKIKGRGINSSTPLYLFFEYRFRYPLMCTI